MDNSVLAERDPKGKLIASHVKPAGETVPEPFIWYYLKQMAIALHRLNNIPIGNLAQRCVVHQ